MLLKSKFISLLVAAVMFLGCSSESNNEPTKKSAKTSKAPSPKQSQRIAETPVTNVSETTTTTASVSGAPRLASNAATSSNDAETADPEEAVASTTEKQKAEPSTADEAVEPAPAVPKTVETGTFTEITKAVDLRKVPIPEDGNVSRRTSAEVWMSLERDVPSSIEFVREHLLKQGCKEIEPLYKMPKPHVGLAFDSGGMLVTAFVSPESSEEGVTSINIVSLGNIDARTLPQPDGAETKDAYRSNIHLVANASVNDVVQEMTRKLTDTGWQLIKDPQGLPQKPGSDPRNLAFVKNGMVVQVYVTANAVFKNKGKTTVLLSYRLVTAELPILTECENLVLDPLKGEYTCKTSRSMAEVIDFFRSRFQSLGWQETKGSRVREKDARLFFKLDNDITIVELRTGAKGVRVSASGLIEKAPKDIERAMAREKAKEEAKRSNFVELPIPEGAEKITYSDDGRDITFESSMTPKELVDFYAKSFETMGWNQRKQFTKISAQNGNTSFDDGDDDAAFINCFKLNDATPTTVSANANSFVWKPIESGAVAVSEKEMPATDTDVSEEAAPLVEDLETGIDAELHDGLPIPANHTDFSSSVSRFRKEMDATTPATVDQMFLFYRKELGALGWKEGSTELESDKATLVFKSDEGTATISLSPSGDKTTIHLESKYTRAAKETGILPKSGSVAIIVGNNADVQAEVTIAGKTVRVAPGEGAKKPDGPRFDLKPGEHTVTVTIGGETKTETVDAGPDQTWGVILLPDGPLALRMY